MRRRLRVEVTACPPGWDRRPGGGSHLLAGRLREALGDGLGFQVSARSFERIVFVPEPLVARRCGCLLDRNGSRTRPHLWPAKAARLVCGDRPGNAHLFLTPERNTLVSLIRTVAGAGCSPREGPSPRLSVFCRDGKRSQITTCWQENYAAFPETCRNKGDPSFGKCGE